MSTLYFCEYSNTIRQIPENYMLAAWCDKRKHWEMNPDLASNKEFIVGLTLALTSFETKYATCAETVIRSAESIITDFKKNNTLFNKVTK